MSSNTHSDNIEKRVLVVDDSRLVRMLIKEGLSRYGYRVIEAMDGMQAVELLQTISDIRLMTLDLTMPRMNGFEVLERLRAEDVRHQLVQMNNHRIPVVVITANDTEEDRLRGFKLGAADFVQKNEARHKLLEVVKKILIPSTEMDDLGVLVAEDSETARSIIVSCLRQIGVNIYTAANGREAFELLRREKDYVDLVLTDLHMPEMNGDVLCMKIRNDLNMKTLPIIVLSGTSERRKAIELYAIGITDYLRKPFLKEEFTARLMAHLEQRRLNRELNENVHKLQGLSELKDRFLAVCTHDLRTPVTGILGFSDLLLDSSELNEDQSEMIRQIRNSGTFLLDLINDILDLGRAQDRHREIERSPLPVLEVLHDTVESLRHLAQAKDIRLVEKADDENNPIVNGNRHALARVFNNLLANAVKFTPTGGTVAVTARCPEPERMVVAFEDTGIGIPPDMINRLFDRYSKISRTGTSGEPGTGLGLTITRELIRAHDGSIKVTSEEGAGTTFTVTLPVIATRPVAARMSARPGNVQQAEQPETTDDDRISSLHVLLAEDNKVNRMLVSRIIKGALHTVVMAEDGQQAVEIFKRQQTDHPFDLMLMDIQMPGLDGFEATDCIRRHEKELSVAHVFHFGGRALDHIPVVAMTAHSADEGEARYLDAGMDGVIHKPLRKNELLDLLKGCTALSGA